MADISQLAQITESLNALFVDDDLELSFEMTELLSELFGELDSVLDPRDALKLIEKKSYDLIFTDLKMPTMSGLQLARRIRMEHPLQKIVIISGAYEPEDFQAAYDMGIDSFIRKPLVLDKFVHQIYKPAREALAIKQCSLACPDINKNESIPKVIKNIPSSNQPSTVNICPIIKKPCPGGRQYDEEFYLSGECPYIVSAQTLAAKIGEDWVEFYERIEELLHLREEIEYIAGLLVISKNKVAILDKTHKLIAHLHSELSIISDLIPITEVLKETEELFRLSATQGPPYNVKQMEIYEAILLDIGSFITNIFEKRLALDINYLTDSLRISIKQLHKELVDKEGANDGNEFEFF